MVHSLSTKVANFLVNDNPENSLKKEWCTYGFEIIISSIITFSILSSLGYLFTDLKTFIIFILEFVLLRKFSGGLHCNTYITCNIGTVLVFCTYLLLLKIDNMLFFYVLSIINLVIGNIMIYFFCPVKNKNKELTKEEHSKYKKVTFCIFNTVFLLSIISNLFEFTFCNETQIILSLVMVLVFIGYLKEDLFYDEKQS